MTRFTPTLTVLEGRDCPASVSLADRALYVTTDSGADVVTIRDDGRGNVRAVVRGPDGEATAAGPGVNRVFVHLRGAADRLDYAVTGRVVKPVAAVIDLGWGGAKKVRIELPADPGGGRGSFDLRGNMGRGSVDVHFGRAGLGGLTVLHRMSAGAVKFHPPGVDLITGVVPPQTARLPFARG